MCKSFSIGKQKMKYNLREYNPQNKGMILKLFSLIFFTVEIQCCHMLWPAVLAL